LEGRVGTLEAALYFSVLVILTFPFPPPPVKLLFPPFLPFLFSSGLPTLGLLSLECLLLLGKLNPSLLADLNGSFWPGLTVSNLLSLFLFLFFTEFFSGVADLTGFLHSGLKRGAKIGF